LANEFLDIGTAADPFTDKRLHGRRGPVEDDAPMPIARQAAHHAAAHASQADHAKLHILLPTSAHEW
jgi:hypothetical protein